MNGVTKAPTFFASPAFGRALEFAFPHLHSEVLRVRIPTGDLHIPLVTWRSRTGFRHASAFPLGGYGCVLRDDGSLADPVETASALELAAARYASISFTPWPLAQEPARLPSSWKHTGFETAIIDCAGGLESALSNMRGVTRRMLGQSVRRGVTCYRADPDEAAIERYYAMLDVASHAWGLKEPTIPLRLLRATFAYGGDDVELWFACVDGEDVAGGVVLCGGEELFFWSAAMRREFAKMRPSNALNARLIQRACERGLRWYNLGASHGLEGVARFKSDLGARSLSYSNVRKEQAPFRIVSRLASALRTSAAS